MKLGKEAFTPRTFRPGMPFGKQQITTCTTPQYGMTPNAFSPGFQGGLSPGRLSSVRLSPLETTIIVVSLPLV